MSFEEYYLSIGQFLELLIVPLLMFHLLFKIPCVLFGISIVTFVFHRVWAFEPTLIEYTKETYIPRSGLK